MATDHPAASDTPSRSTHLPAPVPPPDPLLITDSIEPRPYLEIRPAETSVDPATAARAMATIDVLLRDRTRTGLVQKLRGTTVRPVVEWLLVSDGRSDPTTRYLVGSNDPALTEDLEGVFRTCFPNTYEFRVVEWHPEYV